MYFQNLDTRHYREKNVEDMLSPCFVHNLLRRQCPYIVPQESSGVLMNISVQNLNNIFSCEMYVLKGIDKLGTP